MRIFCLLICFSLTSCINDDSPEQYILESGSYKIVDSKSNIILNLKENILIFIQDTATIIDTVKIGNKFIVKGCPTNFSYSCEMHCYKLTPETLRVLEKTILNPVIGPIGNSSMIICKEPANKTSGGAGLFPEGDTSEFIELSKI